MSKFNQAPAFSVTVSGDIGEYEQGQVLTTALSIADYMRTMYNDTEDNTTLDDAQIMAIVKSIPYVETEGEVHGSSDWEMLVCEAMHKAGKSDRTAPLPDTRSSVAINGSTVSTVADKFAKNAAFTTNLHNAAYAPEEVKKAPLKLLLSVLDVYGLKVDNYGLVEHVEQSAIFSEMPHPESEPSEEYLKANNNKVKPQDMRKFATYKVGDETKDFYKDFIYRQPEGKAIMDEVDQLKIASPGKNKNTSGSKYGNRSGQWIKNQLRLWKSREDGAIKYMKMAVACMYQWKDIVDALGKTTGVRFLMDEEGTPKSRVDEGFSTLQIYDLVAGTRGLTLATPLTISGFNNLDVQKAIDDGGTYVNLRDSTKRGTKEEKTTAISWSKEVWLDNVSMIAELLQGSTIAELIKTANEKDKASKKRTESSKNLIVDMCNLSAEIGSFARLFASDYQKIMIERQEIGQEAAKQVA